MDNGDICRYCKGPHNTQKCPRIHVEALPRLPPVSEVAQQLVGIKINKQIGHPITKLGDRENLNGQIKANDHYGNIRQRISNVAGKKARVKKSEPVNRIEMTPSIRGMVMLYVVGEIDWLRFQSMNRYLIKRSDLVNDDIWSNFYDARFTEMFNPTISASNVSVWNGKLLWILKENWLQYNQAYGEKIENQNKNVNWFSKKSPYSVFNSWDQFNRNFAHFSAIPIVVTSTPPANKDLKIYNPIQIELQQLHLFKVEEFTHHVDCKGKYFLNYPSTLVDKIYQLGKVVDRTEVNTMKMLTMMNTERIQVFNNQNEFTAVVKSYIRRHPKKPVDVTKSKVYSDVMGIVETGVIKEHVQVTPELVEMMFSHLHVKLDIQKIFSNIKSICTTYNLHISHNTPASRIVDVIPNISIATLPDVPKPFENLKLIDKQSAKWLAMYSDGTGPVRDGKVTYAETNPINFKLIRKALNVAWASMGVCIIAGLKGTGKSSLANCLKKELPPNSVIDSDEFLRCRQVVKLLGGVTVYSRMQEIVGDGKDDLKNLEGYNFLRDLLRMAGYRAALVEYAIEAFGGVDNYWTNKFIFVHSMDEAEYLATELAAYVEPFQGGKKRQLSIFQLPAFVHSDNRDTPVEIIMNGVFKSTMNSGVIYSLRDLYNGILIYQVVNPLPIQDSDVVAEL